MCTDDPTPTVMQGGGIIPLNFHFFTDASEISPTRAFFTSAYDCTVPIAKAIYINILQNTGSSIIEFTLGLVRIAALEAWSCVTVDRNWARQLWYKCQFPKGTRERYGRILEDKQLDFVRCVPNDRLELEGEERVFLGAGLFWSYWEKRNAPLKERAADLTEASGSRISGSNLWSRCRWAGLIPLTAEEQSAVDEMLSDMPGLTAEFFLEHIVKDPVDIRLEITGTPPWLRDYAVEKVLKRKFKVCKEAERDAEARWG